MIGLATSPETDVEPARHTPHLSDHALPRAGPQRALIEQVTEPVETIRTSAAVSPVGGVVGIPPTADVVGQPYEQSCYVSA